MIAISAAAGRRLPLDALVARMTDPGFVQRHRRVPRLREREGHASPFILAEVSARSAYVRRWRRHARRCTDCATLFRYLGLSVD